MINGFVVIDKPAGITSHDVVSRVRRILGTRKVGHTGTLDPFATGVLPVAINDGTKAIPFLDEGIKSYEAVMRLGVVTDTLDMTGTVLRESDWTVVGQNRVEAVFSQFFGRTTQIPPMYSAIKCNGQPLYKLARKGQVVERASREIDIHSIELLTFAPPLISFKVDCSRGTYVRTLADDMGSKLGCGAALKELRRLASGPFEICSAITLENLEESMRSGMLEKSAVSPSAALSHLPDIHVNDSGSLLVKHGRSPGWENVTVVGNPVLAAGSFVRLTWNGELLAVAQCMQCDGAVPSLILKRVFI